MLNHQHGAIALVGSGEYLPQAQELESELLRLAISKGKSNTFIQIPTAASKEGDDRLEFWKLRGAEQGARIGCEVKYLPVSNRDDARNPQWIEDVKSAGLIYFSGGDPVHLADTFRDTPLWSAIVSAWQSGASLAGCSAGAMAFGGKIIGIRRSHVSEGLNLLPDIEVIPHYDKFLGWLPDRVTAAIIRQDADATLIGIDEDTALVMTDQWLKYGRGRVHVLRGNLEFS
jgi:cyanophycinase